MKNAKKVLQFPSVAHTVFDRESPLSIMSINDVICELDVVLKLQGEHEQPIKESFLENEKLTIAAPFLLVPDGAFLENPDDLLRVLEPLSDREKEMIRIRIHLSYEVLLDLAQYKDLVLVVPFHWNQRMFYMISGLLHPCYTGSLSY